MQLLPYRVYAHKFMKKRENISNINRSKEIRYPLIIKLAKSFRVQLFLFYYFLIAIIASKVSGITVTLAVLISLLCLTVYSIYQIFVVQYYYFDKEIKILEKQNKRN